ncbi:nucleotide sugar dehydrogenase [Saccharopolyspora sp. CA-218241]|uniref:nucleotide sugar dehydrogenase n=1 Tax=Saccharopolyspora sp. CA-218241 TaxID=3240027 RepID=UPI003D967D7D
MSVDLVVVGLGYVGLPLAARACEAGLSTAGLDVSGEVVAGLGAGRSHVRDVPDAVVADMVATGFTATTDPTVLGTADTIVLCLPTGLSGVGEPDLSAVRAAATEVAARLRPGTLVVLESTSFPGTTEELVRPILERGSGLRVGADFHLAYSPERIDPGNESFGMRNTPKIVSGCTPLCAKYATAFYDRLVDSVVVSRGTREAEMAKLLENTYRYVNIALVNEMSLFCHRVGIDVWDVLRCAATKPFGFTSFQPGPGVGGHCIPIDPVYLESKATTEGFAFRTLAAARSVNEGMPAHVAERVRGALAELGVPVAGARVLLLGVSYKRDCDDTRESPAYPVARDLLAAGAAVGYHDPHVPEFAVDGAPLPRTEDLTAALAAADVVVLMQDHHCYDAGALTASCRALVDTRGMTSGAEGVAPS